MIFSQELVNKLNILCGKKVKEHLDNRKKGKRMHKIHICSVHPFFSELNIRTGNCGRNKGHKCPHCTRMRRLQVYFPFSMTMHSLMLQQHQGIGFRMCCRQATDKKGIIPAYLGFSMIIINNKTKGDFFLVNRNT